MATIEIDGEALDEIIKNEMIQAIYFLRKDMEKIKQTNKGFVFTKDPKVDLLRIDNLIDAYLTVLEHYGYTE
jgi:hypothetical protein